MRATPQKIAVVQCRIFSGDAMGLSTGTKLGPYEIVALLGAGGMGEVYRARDIRLERTVAIKVLHSGLSATPDLKARFDREAKAISQLNHPNICTLHDVGHEGDVDFLVMEFLDGESLADRIKTRGALPLSEIVKIGSEIADALERAHRAGIVHRDLKPGNVMLTKSGAKLLDFGLAKPAPIGAAAGSGTAPLLSAAMTVTSPSPQQSPLTQQGTLIGTVQYMSPEQIQGIEADSRSDIFAFGAMLYEMATGRRAFEGKSQIKVASAILEDEPQPVSVMQKTAPRGLDRLIATCLSKDPAQRLQCAHDVGQQLKWLADADPPRDTAASTTSGGTWWKIATALLFTALVIVAALAWLRWPKSTSLEAYILPPDKTRFTLNVDDASGPIVLSPDGSRVAFVAQEQHGPNRIYVRELSRNEAQPLAGTDNASYPFWSPDSKSLGFASTNKLRRVELAGGPVQDICDVQRFRGGSWDESGIVFAPDVTNGIFHVAATTGATPVQITKVAADQTTNRWPRLLPDGEHFLYLATNHSSLGEVHYGIYFASIDGKENRLLLPAQSSATYAHGHLLWGREGSLLAQPFDPHTGKLSGEAVAVAGNVAYNASTFLTAFDANDNGMLVYQSGLSQDSGQLLVSQPGGKSVPIPDTTSLVDVAISPDGHKAAVLSTKAGHDLWLLDLDRGTRVRFTFAYTTDGFAWTKDSKALYYVLLGKPNRIMRKAVDGASAEEEIFKDEEQLHISGVSPDGKLLLIQMRSERIPFTTWILPTAAGSRPKLLTQEPVGTYRARFSPDGKWILYQTSETGRLELYVTPASGGGKQQITSTGAYEAEWSNDLKTLYFVGPNNTVSALPITITGTSIQTGDPKPISTFNSQLVPQSFFSQSWDITPDGRRMLLSLTGEDSEQSRAVLVTDWVSRVARK
jgi:serine/threonine protein kinase